MLNRAPTLHRLGIQAFEPVLVEGKAIRLHPLVCAAYNADFDGDQMAVHVPLSVEAQLEAKVLMMATPEHPLPGPRQAARGAVAGHSSGRATTSRRCASATPGREMLFSSRRRGRARPYDAGIVGLQAGYHRPHRRASRVETTTGRAALQRDHAQELPFALVNREMNKKQLVELVDQVYRNKGLAATIKFLDDLKDLGFHSATRAGISIGINDMQVPTAKGRSSPRPWPRSRRSRSSTSWVTSRAGEAQQGRRRLDHDHRPCRRGDDEGARHPGRHRGSIPPSARLQSDLHDGRLRRPRLASPDPPACRYARPDGQAVGEIIETPITANFREGLSVLQYFVSTHGARKGLADTALKTANSGYLTRRLVDVANDTVITDARLRHPQRRSRSRPSSRAANRRAPEGPGSRPRGPRRDPRPGSNRKVIVPANHEIDEDDGRAIDDAGLDKVKIRSVLTCEAKHGVCQLCYGRDLPAGAWSTSARRSASSPPSPSASRAPS